MRIIVISDTHQYYRNFETIVLRNPDADMFLHLGDGESEYQLLCRNMPEVADKFRYVKGNCDYGSDAPLTELIDVAPHSCHPRTPLPCQLHAGLSGTGGSGKRLRCCTLRTHPRIQMHL